MKLIRKKPMINLEETIETQDLFLDFTKKHGKC